MTPFMILCFSFFVYLIGAVPLEQRDVFNPPITSPNASTTWRVHEKRTVTWDTANMPPDDRLTNPIGQVVLGFEDSHGLNLMLNSPLARDFKLRAGQVDIIVPDVPVRNNYIVVVFGDSGNASPHFTILGGLAPSSSAVASSSTASETASPSTLTAPIPISGTVITGASTEAPVTTPATSTTPEVASSLSAALATATNPVSSPSSTSSAGASSVSSSGSAIPAQASGNSAPKIGVADPLMLGPAFLAIFALL